MTADLFEDADRQLYDRTLAGLRAELAAAGADAAYMNDQTWDTAPKAEP